MRGLVSLCVRHYGFVTALSILALFLGCWGVMRAPLDVFPEFVPSQVDIQTEAPGFAPQQVEELVTKRIESAVNGAAGLATLRSESIPGLSVVIVTFTDKVDVHIARQGISERLSEIGSTLPTGVGTPKLSPLVSSTMDLLKIGLVSDKVDAYALRDAADWVIKPRLLAVPGVAHVLVFGGDVRQIQIQPDPNKLASYHVTLVDVGDAARGALALHGAGFIDMPAQRVLLRSPTPKPDAAAIGQAVIAVRNGVPVLVRDVAEVKEAPALRSGDALIMGKPGVMLSLASQYGANTLSTTLAIEQVLANLAPALQAQGITVYPAMHRPANFIERALGDLENSLAIAALLILAVLYLFLRDVRAAVIAFTAIPLSLLAAVLVLDRMGQTLNTMTLGGFARSEGSRHLRNSGRDRSLPAGTLYLQRSGTFRGALGARLHSRGHGFVARRDDRNPGHVRTPAAGQRRALGVPLAGMVEKPASQGRTVGRGPSQARRRRRGCVLRGRRRRGAVSRRNLHA